MNQPVFGPGGKYASNNAMHSEPNHSGINPNGPPGPLPTVFTVDGIFSNGRRSVDVFGAELLAMGYDVVDITMPYDTIFTAQMEAAQKRRARILLDHPRYIPGRCWVLAHSNGCQLALWAARLGANFAGAILVNAAVPADVVFPHDFARQILVIYSPHDRVLWLGQLLPGFGTLGRDGYQGTPDSRVRSVANDDKCGWLNHGCAFKNPGKWLPLIHAAMKPETW